ncbi:hypothetical protein [Marinobacter sp. HN1S83]|uniref:hypothetical protein n=1 Tax=Marinobacter sp. HN1S83 TaxID=3382301 RepID=UPI00387ABB1D
MVNKRHEYTAFSDVAPRKVNIGPPLSWVVEAIGLFRAHWKIVLPAYLIVALLPQAVLFGILALNSRMGLFGHVSLVLFCIVMTLVFYGGMMALYHGAVENRARFKDVFAGFSGHGVVSMIFLPVFIGLAAAAMWVACVSIVSVVDAGPVIWDSLTFRGFSSRGWGHSGSELMPALIVVLGLGLLTFAVLGALFCFVIPLVVVSEMGVSHAVLTSLKACLPNLFTLFFFVVNGMALGYLFFLSMVSLGAASTSLVVLSVAALIAVLVFGAVMSGAHYLAFRDVLLVDSLPDAASATTDNMVSG